MQYGVFRSDLSCNKKVWKIPGTVATQVTSSLYLVRLWGEPQDGDDANANANASVASHPL